MRRLQELCGGAIVIDGVDIAKMGLKQLRSSMAIIPQVPPCPFLRSPELVTQPLLHVASQAG
jgi:ABC-type cobalamin/Fe3+-siderophores transport system ATPase subunit